MATYRYPLDVTTSESTYLIFTRAKNKGFTTSELRDITKSTVTTKTESGFGLPIPDTISDDSNINYSDIQDSSVAAQATQAVVNKVAGDRAQQEAKMATGKTKAIQNMMLFDSVGIKTWNFTWKMVPESKEEMSNIESIIKEFELGKLPTYEGVIMSFPDIFNISFGGVKPKLIKFLPCVVTSVSAQYGESEFQIYTDGGFPSITLTVGFSELVSRSREIQQSLYDSNV